MFIQPTENRSPKKIWKIRPQKASDLLVDEISERFDISKRCAGIVCERVGADASAAELFLTKSKSILRDPFLLADMRPAVERIIKAIDSGEIIAIYGDYDADGVTSTSLLYLYLVSRGAHVGYYIPKRSDEGYGMSREGVEKLSARGVTLIITVDTGVTAVAEVEHCRALGIDVVITDHHECLAELPQAVAVVDPHRSDCPYPFKEMAGVGVALKLVTALEASYCDDVTLAAERMLFEYADLAAIGTVADVMPLVDENRVIVSEGLKLINSKSRLGVAALVDAASGTKEGRECRVVDASFIGFGIAPRINAAGRMESASLAVELLLAETAENAEAVAEYLCDVNKQRQTVENAIIDEAVEKLYEEQDLTKDKVIVLADDGWNHGVIGIVASRLTEKFSMPTILVTFDGTDPLAERSEQDIGKGSGRSIKGMNLVEALTHCSDLLVKYGGHELAAGLSVKRQDLPEFRRRINEYARNIFTEGDSEIVLEADGVLAPEEITTLLAVQSASLIEPCGAGNPTPAFILMDATVTAIRAVGSGKHCKLSLEAGGRYFNAMYFGISPAELSCERGDGVDVLFNVGINQYMGRKELQLTVIDVRPSERAINQLRAQEARVADILAGGTLSAREMPSRKDMVNLYSIICELGTSVSLTDRYALYLLRTKLPERDMIGYVKYKLIVEIFASTGIFNIRKTVCDECVTSFEKVEHKNKIDIEGSELFLSLKSRIGEDA